MIEKTYIQLLKKLPDTQNKVLVVLSGGMDSTVALRLVVEKYGADNVVALTFNYGQKQKIETILAEKTSKRLGVEHKHLDISFLGDISKGFSANTDNEIEMPTIEDVLGDPSPVTYVPNRNMIILSIASSYAEVIGAQNIFIGLQVHDEYGYWDTTGIFVSDINKVLSNNRKTKINIVAPFSDLSKTDELNLLLELDGDLSLLKTTITCYNPKNGLSCGVCPSCSERLNAFKNLNVIDPISYI